MNSMRKIFRLFLVAGLAAFMCAEALAEPTAKLSVSIRETGSEAPLPCRVWVESSGKRWFPPEGSPCTVYDRDRSFSCDGQFTMSVPPGKATIHVERGKEYLPVDETVVLEDGRTSEKTVKLSRWIDMSKDGWYSADFHVHFIRDDRRVLEPAKAAEAVRVLKQLAMADDVNWVPAFSFWNNNIERWPDWPGGAAVRVDDKHLVTLNNEEIERIAKGDGPAFESVGAPLFFGLTKPVYVLRIEPAYPCDAALCRMARKTSPDCVIDTDKALWAENVVGAALGLFDCVQLCHNHYHRDKTLRMGWGMIGPESDEERNLGKNELLMRTNLVYYRWLNCGFRLAASGGSAIGVMPVPAGYSRTYAKLDGPFSEAEYLKAVRGGRTFATTGPMLLLTVDGKLPGDRIKCRSQENRPVTIRAELHTSQPIEALAVIQNGQVIKSVPGKKPDGPASWTQTVELAVTPQRSGWVAARATFATADGSLHQAHTSPVYLEVDGKPTAFRKDAEYMIRWIDRILQISEQPERYSSPQDRIESQTMFREARAVYERVAQTASAVWGDR